MANEFNEITERGGAVPDPRVLELGEITLGTELEPADDAPVEEVIDTVALGIEEDLGADAADDEEAELPESPQEHEAPSPGIDAEADEPADAPLAGSGDTPVDPPDTGSGVVSPEGEPEPFLGPGAYARLREARERFEGAFYPYGKYMDGGPYHSEEERTRAAFDAEVTIAADAAQREQLTPEQTEDLLRHTLDSLPTSTEVDESPEAMIYVGRAIEAAAATMPEGLTEVELAGMKGVITASIGKGVVIPSLAVYDAGCRAGLPPADSAHVTTTCVENTPIWSATEDLQALRDVLRTVRIAGVDPAALRVVVENISTTNPTSQGRDFEALRAALIFECSAGNITPNELLQATAAHLEGEASIEETAQSLYGAAVVREAESATARQDPVAAREYAINRRFVAHSGPLVQSSLYYQSERSLDAGIADLHDLADARRYRGEEVARGSWVHDPATGHWYSMGSQTAPGLTTTEASRNRTIPFDVSELSDMPHVFTTHPRDMTIGEAYALHALPRADDIGAIAYTMATASTPVAPRSFIVTTYGITELSCPSDPAAVADLAAQYDVYRDLALMDVDPIHLGLASTSEAAGTAMARQVVDRLNETLPDGFTARFYPRGTIPEGMNPAG